MVMKKGIIVLAFIYIAINQAMGQINYSIANSTHLPSRTDSCMLLLSQTPTYQIQRVGKYCFLFKEEKYKEKSKPVQEKTDKPIHLSLNSYQDFDIKNLYLPQRNNYHQTKAADIFFEVTSLFLDIMFPCRENIDL